MDKWGRTCKVCCSLARLFSGTGGGGDGVGPPDDSTSVKKDDPPLAGLGERTTGRGEGEFYTNSNGRGKWEGP